MKDPVKLAWQAAWEAVSGLCGDLYSLRLFGFFPSDECWEQHRSICYLWKHYNDHAQAAWLLELAHGINSMRFGLVEMPRQLLTRLQDHVETLGGCLDAMCHTTDHIAQQSLIQVAQDTMGRICEAMLHATTEEPQRALAA